MDTRVALLTKLNSEGTKFRVIPLPDQHLAYVFEFVGQLMDQNHHQSLHQEC